MRRIDGGDRGGLSDEAAAAMGRTLSELIEAHVADERITTIFSTLWGYLGLVPSKVCAFTYAMMWNSFHHGGCFYVRGGGQALSDAFVAVIEEHGGRVLLNTPVATILTDAGRVVGVETERRGVFRAPAVVSNASAPATFHHLLDRPELGAQDLAVVDTLPVACSIHQTYVGMRGDAAALSGVESLAETDDALA